MSTHPSAALGSHGPASKTKIFTWALWDWGTQPFATVITTFVFAVYITSSAFGTKNYTSIAMSISTGIAGFLIAVLAPVLGQSADRRGRRMAVLRVATMVIAVVSAALYFVQPAPSYLILGLTLLGIGSIVAEIANVNYYAILDEVATPENVGKVSGFGWGMGYLGGIVMLLVLFFGLIQPDVGWFGVTDEGAMDIRVSMVLCGIWTLMFTLPLFFTIKDRPRTGTPEPLGIRKAYQALFISIRTLWAQSRHTAYFLLASALFRDGLAGVFTFGAVIAAGTFGLSAGEVIIFGAAANVVAGVSTMLFGFLDDKLGPKKVIMISLLSLVVIGLAIFVAGRAAALEQLTPERAGQAFWALGMALTVFVGPAQSASRSFLARLAPEGKSGELFGLYVTTGRAVSFFSPLAFGGSVIFGALLTGREETQYWGILGIVLILALGALVMWPVKEPREAAVL